MSLKTAACRFGNAVLDATTVMHNASIDAEIDQIDEEMSTMRKQLARLEEQRSELEERKI